MSDWSGTQNGTTAGNAAGGAAAGAAVSATPTDLIAERALSKMPLWVLLLMSTGGSLEMANCG